MSPNVPVAPHSFQVWRPRAESFTVTTRSGVAESFAVWFRTFVGLLLVYGVTAHWSAGDQVNDTLAAAWPAWHLANEGSWDLAGATGLPDLPWFVEVDGRVVSSRMMGVLLVPVPLAFSMSWSGLSAAAVGTLTAVLLTSAALGNMHIVLRRLLTDRWALTATVVLALGTSVWTTAAAELWTHGPDLFWLSLALLALSRGRTSLTGLALLPAVITRPHLAVVALFLGVGHAWARRSLRPLLDLGVPSAAALTLLLVWNRWYYDHTGLTAPVGYSGRVQNIVSTPVGGATRQWLDDLIGATLSPAHGVVVYSPVLLVLLVTAVSGWRQVPGWARCAFVGGLAYQVLQLRLNRYTGGGGFYGYRLPLECIFLAWPLLIMGVASTWRASSLHRRQFVTALAGVSVGIHAFGAITYLYWVGTVQDAMTWYPWVVARAAGPMLPAALLVAFAAPVLGLLLERRHGHLLNDWRPAAQRPSPPAEQDAPSSAPPAPPPGAGASAPR